ncbi:MAG: hypothetical protein ACOX5J_09005 [Candidatus Hydrogenedentales bacterium]
MRAYYCPGTHWDREWYEPFQEFRMWLVELVDDLLDLLERQPAYTCFHLDGQAVVLEDYLRVRPENRERLVAQMRAGSHRGRALVCASGRVAGLRRRATSATS